jgi:tRNA-dihydrouridine synthase
MIDVSSGQVSPAQKPTYGRMYQTPFADRIRQEAGIATIAVGAISEADHVNSIIAAGRADLCAVARPHLANPAWTLTEAARIGYTPMAWPRSTARASRRWRAACSHARRGPQGLREDGREHEAWVVELFGGSPMRAQQNNCTNCWAAAQCSPRLDTPQESP